MIKRLLFIILLMCSPAIYAGTGMGFVMGAATAAALSSAQADSNSDAALSMEICKAQQNINDVRKCLIKLQTDQDISDRHWRNFFLIVLSVIFVFFVLLIFS